MKKKVKDILKPREKQELSLEKAITTSIIIASGLVKLGSLKVDEAEDNIFSRLKGVKQKYGFHKFMKLAPKIIEKMKEKPVISLVLNKDKEENVTLLWQCLENYYNKYK